MERSSVRSVRLVNIHGNRSSRQVGLSSMRTREEIIESYDAYNAEVTITELLLDIRDILIANRKPEGKSE